MKKILMLMSIFAMLLSVGCSSYSSGSDSGGSGEASLVGIWRNVDDLWDTVDFYKFTENGNGFAFYQCGTEEQKIVTFYWEIQGSRLCFSNFGEAQDDFCFRFSVRNDTLTFDGIYTRTNELPNCL